MKTINVKSFFKLTKEEKKAGKTVKRPDLAWTYEGYAADQFAADLVEANVEHVTAALNSVLESYGAHLLATNKDNYSYSPVGVSLENWYNWFTTSSRGKREVTAATLDAFATCYATLAGTLLGKSLGACTSGAAVIRAKFAPIMGQKDALDRMAENLVQLVEVVETSDTPTALDQHTAVIEYLLKLVTEANAVVSVDDL